jgi:hypothetical protein
MTLGLQIPGSGSARAAPCGIDLIHFVLLGSRKGSQAWGPPSIRHGLVRPPQDTGPLPDTQFFVPSLQFIAWMLLPPAVDTESGCAMAAPLPTATARSSATALPRVAIPDFVVVIGVSPFEGALDLAGKMGSAEFLRQIVINADYFQQVAVLFSGRARTRVGSSCGLREI